MNEEGSMSGIVPELDRDRIEELYGDDRQWAVDIFSVFLSQMAEELPMVDAFLQKEQWAETAAVMHKIVPSFGMVGLTGLETELRRIEKLVKNPESRQQAVACWADFRKATDGAIRLVEAEIRAESERA